MRILYIISKRLPLNTRCRWRGVVVNCSCNDGMMWPHPQVNSLELNCSSFGWASAQAYLTQLLHPGVAEVTPLPPTIYSTVVPSAKLSKYGHWTFASYGPKI